jgi:hypothetical protein
MINQQLCALIKMGYKKQNHEFIITETSRNIILIHTYDRRENGGLIAPIHIVSIQWGESCSANN